MTKRKILISSESVTEGHPDKMCDLKSTHPENKIKTKRSNVMNIHIVFFLSNVIVLPRLIATYLL